VRRHGFEDITILEGASDLGGTWFSNSYPGAACDVPSHLYSFSYEQRTSWSRLCSPQQEILGYLRDVAQDDGVTDLIRFSQRVSDCTFNPAGWGSSFVPLCRVFREIMVLRGPKSPTPRLRDHRERLGPAGAPLDGRSSRAPIPRRNADGRSPDGRSRRGPQPPGA
jgi:hypothetical protein